MDMHKWIRNYFVDNAIAPQGLLYKGSSCISLKAKQFIDFSSDFTLKSIYTTALIYSLLSGLRLDSNFHL